MPEIIRSKIYSESEIIKLKDLLIKNKFYLAIGKTTPWSSVYGEDVDDTNPPVPENNFPDLQALKLAQFATFIVRKSSVINSNIVVKEIDADLLQTSTTQLIEEDYVLLDLGKTSTNLLVDLNVERLYIEGTFTAEDFQKISIAEFRAFGLYINSVTPSTSLLTFGEELKNTNLGILNSIHFRTPIQIEENTSFTAGFII